MHRLAKIKTVLALGLAGGLLMLYGVPARATTMGGDSIQAGPLSLGGRAMYFDPRDADKATWSGGAQLRYYLNQAIGVEGSVDYRRNDFDGTRTHVYPVQASLLLNLIPNSPVSIFALAGAGWYYTTVDQPDGSSNTQNRFGPHVGAGVEFYLNKFWSIDGTYRYIWLKDINSQNQSLLNATYNDSGHMITAGLNYHF